MAHETIVEGNAAINGEITPILTLVGDRPMVSSIKVAEHFEKRHDNVVRDIKSLIEQAPECVLNFEETLILIPMPKGGHREVPGYDMDEDGFSLLAMGFTGKKAVRWKIVYVKAFRAYRQELHGRALPASDPQPVPLTKSTVSDRQPLKDLVDAWVGTSPLSYHSAWKQVHAHFGITAIGDLPKEWIPDAIAFVQDRIDNAQSSPKALPESPKLALPAAQVDDLKDKAVAYYNAIMDANYQWNKIIGDVERKGRELSDAMGAAIMPMIGSDSDPASVVARHKFLDALKSSPRCAMRSMDVSILALIDHAQLMCGLSVLGR